MPPKKPKIDAKKRGKPTNPPKDPDPEKQAEPPNDEEVEPIFGTRLWP